MSSTPVEVSRTSALALCGTSAVLLAISLWIAAQWWTASSAAGTHEASVRYFLAHVPLGLGELGAANLTRLSAAAGVLGLVSAAVAARGLRGGMHALSIALAWANGILAAWYLFSMM